MICNIQVDVNGEQLFFVDKDILAYYSNRVSKLYAKIINNAKLIFSDFPGGSEGFELITRFCYNNGTIEITPSNIFLLHSGGSFMEITTLIKQTELYLEGIHCWTWSDILSGLKQCNMLYSFLNKSPMFQVFLNTLLGNLTIPSYDSSCPSSSNSSSFRFSTSDHSPKSSRCNTHIEYWKFDDLSFLNMNLFENVVKSMISLHLDTSRICALIFHYQKSKFFTCYSHDEKCKMVETNINLLSLVNGSAFSCRALLDAFGMSLSMNLRTNERLKLENLLGSRLDEFTVNDLLVRGKKKEVFDVDLIIQLIKSFLLEKRINGLFAHRVKKVGFLMDLLMLEVAPDPFLKPSKFLALAMALPDFARESHDGLYHAIDLYIEVHARGLSEEQTTKLWSVINLNKCSMVKTRLNLSLNENMRLLPFDHKQNRFKGSMNNDYRVLGKQGSKVTQDTPKFVPKKSRILVDPCNAKSLPRLCH
ncbi:BTB/POZ domain-containing protein At3g22104-like [Bidens hawaiensis]|uniref:BTB/POZ domain-containing protein At3g22104-like n=1 Tax=Bidens hawaiensis TaxID=980011 RepID=UPI0040495471